MHTQGLKDKQTFFLCNLIDVFERFLRKQFPELPMEQNICLKMPGILFQAVNFAPSIPAHMDLGWCKNAGGCLNI